MFNVGWRRWTRRCKRSARHALLSCPPPQRLQEAEARNQELSQSVTSATRPLLRQIENLQASLGGQAASWEKLEKNISDRLGESHFFESGYLCGHRVGI